MRHVTAGFGVGLLALSIVGCNSLRWPLVRPHDNNVAVKPGAGDGKVPDVASLVAYMNDNAGRVKTLQATSLEVTCSAGTQRINLHGKMVAEKPRGFRMSLDGPLGFSQVADLGSNNQEFWFWIKAAPGDKQVPPQYYCSYQDLDKGVPFMPIPFQPQWIMEALGLGPYGPAERYELQHDDQTVRLIEKTRSPQGLPVLKVIVMKRRETRAPDPQVTHYLLINDTTKREICSAHITQTMVDPTTGAILPKRLELSWPQEKASLSLIMDKMAVNAPIPPEAFVRRPLRGVQSYNLASVQPSAPGVQPVQGLFPSGQR